MEPEAIDPYDEAVERDLMAGKCPKCGYAECRCVSSLPVEDQRKQGDRRSDTRCTCGHGYTSHSAGEACFAKETRNKLCQCQEFVYAHDRRNAMCEAERAQLSLDAGRELSIEQAYQVRMRQIHIAAVDAMLGESNPKKGRL